MNWKITRREFVWKSSLLASGLLAGAKGVSGSAKATVRFGLAADSHYADRKPRGTRYFRQSLDKMKEFVKVMNREKVDFAVHLGDFKDQDPGKKAEDTLKYLREIEGVYAQYEGPRYHCIGNHDVDSITKQQFLENVENTGIPKDKSYYSFDQGGIHFIVLDANYHKDGRDHFYKKGAKWQDTNLTPVQLDWLKQDLAATNSPTVVFCHHPLYEYYHKSKKYYVNDPSTVQEIMVSSGQVMAVFQGHVHNEQFKEINGIHYITQWGMVDYKGLKNNSFAVVEIGEGTVNIIGYKRVSDRRLVL